MTDDEPPDVNAGDNKEYSNPEETEVRYKKQEILDISGD